MKVCLEFEWGGHVEQMLSILDALEGHSFFFVTSKSDNTKILERVAKVYWIKGYRAETGSRFAHIDVLIKYCIQQIFAFATSIKIFVREWPQVIITTGGGATLPLCYLGKLFRRKIVFLESLARVYNPSGTGKLVYPIADIFLVQWEPLLKKYGKKAQYWGRVL